MIEFLESDAIQQIKAGVGALRAALAASKDSQDLAQDEPVKEAALKRLAKAEIAIELAEAQIAQALGYKLCQCAFPPKIMLSVGRDTVEDTDIFRCSSCGMQEPSEEHLTELEFAMAMRRQGLQQQQVERKPGRRPKK